MNWVWRYRKETENHYGDLMTHLQLWSLYKKLPQVLSFPSAHISSLSPLPNSILPLLGPRGLSKSPRRSLPRFLKLCSSELVLPIPEAQMSYSLQDKGEASPLGVISRVACQQATDDKIKPCELSGDLGCWQETENKFSWMLKESYPLVGLGLLVLVGVAGPWKKQKASCGPLWLPGLLKTMYSLMDVTNKGNWLQSLLPFQPVHLSYPISFFSAIL